MQSSAQREVYWKRAPALSPEHEQELVRRWQRKGDQSARNQLVQSQLGYVLVVARRNHHPGTSINELLAEGSLGLIRAAEKFDPDRGYRFFTYAKHWVHVYISKCVSRQSTGTLQNTRLLNKVRRERARAVSLVGEGQEARCVVAERMGLSDAEVEALLYTLDQREVSLDGLDPEQLASASEPREHETDPEQAIVQKSDTLRREAVVREVIGTLDAREHRIALRRLMADSDAVLTLEQLGREFGVSRERVRQLEERLKHKLARQLEHLDDRHQIKRRLAA